MSEFVNEKNILDKLEYYEKVMIDTVMESVHYSIETLSHSNIDWITESGIGKNVGAKISNACKSIKNFLNSLKDTIFKVLEPAINLAKKSINKGIKNTEIKDEYTKPQKMIFNILNSLLKSIKEYAVKVRDDHGYERAKALILLVSVPIPGPGTTEIPLLLFKLIDVAIDYKNKLKVKDLENAVDNLDKTVSDMEKIDPKMASLGTKLLDKLRKVLSITKNQIIKVVNKLKTFGKPQAVTESVEDVRLKEHNNYLDIMSSFEYI